MREKRTKEICGKMQRKWHIRGARFNRKTNYVLHQLTNIPVLICLFQMHDAVANSRLSCVCVRLEAIE